jgi:heme-degrading monooxygenase HmoA
MIAVIWRTPRTSREDDGLFDKFKTTPGIVSSYQLATDDEIAVVTIWDSAASRDAYMQSTLQSEVVSAHPAHSRTVYEVMKTYP